MAYPPLAVLPPTPPSPTTLLQFSYPTYRSSLSIMVHATETADNGWFFLRPFK